MDYESIIKIYAEVNNVDPYEIKKDVRKGWISKEELFEAWLKYEGIFGYTHKILSVLEELNKYAE